jgi:hypothetical protein
MLWWQRRLQPALRHRPVGRSLSMWAKDFYRLDQGKRPISVSLQPGPRDKTAAALGVHAKGGSASASFEVASSNSTASRFCLLKSRSASSSPRPGCRPKARGSPSRSHEARHHLPYAHVAHCP